MRHSTQVLYNNEEGHYPMTFVLSLTQADLALMEIELVYSFQ